MPPAFRLLRSVVGASCAMLLVAAIVSTAGAKLEIAHGAGDCTADASLDAEEQAFLSLINTYRQQNNLPTLSASYSLSRSSQWKSTDLGQNAYFAHDDLTRTWVQRIRDCGYGYNTYLGENIAAGYSTAQAAFNAWKASAGHNANMLGANYRTVGIGRAYTAGSPYGWYWTTDFGGVAEAWPSTTTATAATTRTSTPSATRTSTVTPTRTATNTATATRTPSPTATAAPAVFIDSDGDGCSDAAEAGPDHRLGGDRDPASPWDFYDVPAPALTASDHSGRRDRAVTLADVDAVLAYAGARAAGSPNARGIDYDSDVDADGVADGRQYDRSTSAIAGKPWRSGAPDGSITLSDVSAALAQAGDRCIAP